MGLEMPSDEMIREGLGGLRLSVKNPKDKKIDNQYLVFLFDVEIL